MEELSLSKKKLSRKEHSNGAEKKFIRGLGREVWTLRHRENAACSREEVLLGYIEGLKSRADMCGMNRSELLNFAEMELLRERIIKSGGIKR